MKKIFFLCFAVVIALLSVSCSKKSSDAGDPFEGVWYITTISEDQEIVTKGSGEEYWDFKKNGTVIIHDTSIPELGGGSAPKPFSYQAETRLLTVDAFTYEVLVSNSSELRLKSRFSPEVWSRESYIVISFQRSRKGL